MNEKKPEVNLITSTNYSQFEKIYQDYDKLLIQIAKNNKVEDVRGQMVGSVYITDSFDSELKVGDIVDINYPNNKYTIAGIVNKTNGKFDLILENCDKTKPIQIKEITGKGSQTLEYIRACLKDSD